MPKKITKMWWVLIAIALIFGGLHLPYGQARAENCPTVRIVFARGSGATRNNNADYQNFKSTLEDKLRLISLDYDFIDLDYPAIGVDNASTLLGAYFGAGESYDFGKSINNGVAELRKLINNTCPETKYVVAGYSQGAIVVSKALSSLRSDKIIYVATFGDPKIYLPEGKGAVPPACSNQNLSNYRIYVPDCFAYEGLLGSNKPYQPEDYIDKLGTWCNKYDIFCSSYYSINSHVSYISDNLYEDASKLIFAKITESFGIHNDYVSPHDTAILIDSTGSMSGLINKYKAEALRLAEKTLESGGRVALYDYRDLEDPYHPVEHCNFTTCTLEKFQSELNTIVANGGGDTPESLLSSSYTMMQKLEWKRGATKSVVVLTDAGFHSPDLDGKTFADVVALSKSIDPVNFYIITTSDVAPQYNELAKATGGDVATTLDDLSILTDTIMARYDSLPRVEESLFSEELPEIEVLNIEDEPGGSISIRFKTSGVRTMVILNDYVLGITEEDFIVIEGLNREAVNNVALVPLSNNRRGTSVRLEIPAQLIIPKAPDTGKV